MKIICIIPARYQSSRFPGKPLANILGKPMIYWVYNTMAKIAEIDQTFVATDDERISRIVSGFGGKAILTGECSCGTERVYEACKDKEFDIALNIQGDEPMIKQETVADLISAFKTDDVQMATLKKKIDSEAALTDSNIVKVVTNYADNALYFSRSPIPFCRDKLAGKTFYKHIGAYGYTKKFLKEFVSLPRSSLEAAEELEQLRILENGFPIKVVETKYESFGVDVPEHICIVEKLLKEELRHNG